MARKGDPSDPNDGRVEFAGEVTLDTAGSPQIGNPRVIGCHFVRIYTPDSTTDTVVEFATDGNRHGSLDANRLRERQ